MATAAKPKNSKPAKVRRGEPDGATGQRPYVVTCSVYNCRGYKEERTSQQGANQEKSRHNREKHGHDGPRTPSGLGRAPALATRAVSVAAAVTQVAEADAK